MDRQVPSADVLQPDELRPVLPSNLVLPERVVTRRGGAQELESLAGEFGTRGLLVHGRSLRGTEFWDCRDLAASRGLAVEMWEHTGGEPDLATLGRLLTFARQRDVQWVAGVGGGSVMDLAKACAGLLHAPGEPASYHDGAPIPASRTPFLAVPTTAGTGSECTVVCVLTNEKTGVKKSFRHPSFMARQVILDGGMLESCPRAVIAASGMDALTQAIESFVSRGSTWLTDELALKGMTLIHSSLDSVYSGQGGAFADRLLMGSFLAGLALSNARLGIVHGLAHPLGARFHAAHGLVCAVCLPHALEFNRDFIGAKWGAVNRALGGDALASVNGRLERLGLASPFKGRRLDDRAAAVEEVLASGSTAANPRPVGPGDVEWFLGRLFGSEA